MVSWEEIGTFLDLFEVKGTTFRNLGELLLWISACEIRVQCFQYGWSMQLRKLLPEYIIHARNITSMWPEGIMHSCIGNTLTIAFQGSVHHMCRIQGMHEIRWEGSILFLFINWLIIQAFCYSELLNHSADNTLLTLTFVGLYTGKSEGSDPLDGLPSAGNHLGAFWEPFFYVVGVAEEVSDTLNSYLSQILGSLIQLSISFIQFSILKLSLDLFPCSNEGHTIHGSHYSLLNNLTGHMLF